MARELGKLMGTGRWLGLVALLCLALMSAAVWMPLPSPAPGGSGWMQPALAEVWTPSRHGAEGRPSAFAPDAIEVWWDGHGAPQPLGQGEPLRPGDRVQVVVRQPVRPWATLVGRDGAGRIEVYGSWQVFSRGGGWQPAPFSLTLDRTPGPQDLLVVFTDHRISDDAAASTLAGRSVEGGIMAAVRVEKQP